MDVLSELQTCDAVMVNRGRPGLQWATAPNTLGRQSARMRRAPVAVRSGTDGRGHR